MPDIRPDPDRLRARRENDAERQRCLDYLNQLARQGDDVIDAFLIVMGLDELWASPSPSRSRGSSARWPWPRAPRRARAAPAGQPARRPGWAGRSTSGPG